MSPDPSPLLQVEHLTTAFPVDDGWAPAVNDVSLTVARGETLALVGESGSGKSLTALSIMRLVEPPGRVLAGIVRFGDRGDLLSLPERDMRHIRGAQIGLVLQEPMTALNPVFTIGSHITETLRVHGLATSRAAARARAIELLDAVRVPEPHLRVDDYPHQLSGGLRQRALIAAALACRPALLIADEPTTALDVTIQAQILDLLRDLKAHFDLSLLLITHDLGIVAHNADRVAVMYAGRIVETAPVHALFADPRHPYTRGLLASIPGRTPGTRLHAIEGTVPRLGRVAAGCAFAPRCESRFEPCTRALPALTLPSRPSSSIAAAAPHGAASDADEAGGGGGDHAVRCFLHHNVSELTNGSAADRASRSASTLTQGATTGGHTR
jgi:peptide/nickel transport system ATP-binding protein